VIFKTKVKVKVIHRWGLVLFLGGVYNVNQVGKGGKSVNNPNTTKINRMHKFLSTGQAK